MTRGELVMEPLRPMLNGKPSELLEAFPALAEEGLGVIDVGSRGGIQAMFRELAPLLHVVGFEPDRDECQRLAAAASAEPFRSTLHLPYALGAADGEGLLHVNRERGTSSLYEPNREWLERFPNAARYDVVTTVPVPVRSLDRLVADPEVRMPRHIDFMKIDTQGSELDILKGAQQTLQCRGVAIEVEVEFAPLYRKQPLFRDIDAWMHSHGFSLFKLRRQSWVRRTAEGSPHLSAGQLVFADALYLRDPLGEARDSLPYDPRQVEALILIAVLYDFFDVALELISAPSMTKGLDVARIRRWVMHRSRRLASLRERLRRVKALTVSGDMVDRYRSRWTRGDDDFYSGLGP